MEFQEVRQGIPSNSQKIGGALRKLNRIDNTAKFRY
jgi:hypothetical protein